MNNAKPVTSAKMWWNSPRHTGDHKEASSVGG
jgi:hypothetical protein